MRKVWFSATLAVVAICAASVLTSSVFAATRAVSCPSFVGGPTTVTTLFSKIQATGVSCAGAKQVLGAYAQSGHNGTFLGYTCSATKVAGRPGVRVVCTARKSGQQPKQVTAQATRVT